LSSVVEYAFPRTTRFALDVAARSSQVEQVTTPFLGRGELFANALTALQQRRVVALYGVEGLGKTRLALELAQALAPSSAKRAVIRGSTELQRFPFSPILHLVRPELNLANPILAIREAVDDLLAQPVIVLVVDDVQLLDPNTEAVLHTVATRSGPRIIITARTNAMPDSFRRLQRDHDAFVAELDPLDDTATRALCAAVAGSGLSTAAESRLLALAGGNPLLAVELTRSGLASGALVASDSVLQLVSPLPAAKLRDLVASQLGTLSTAERRALELLALAVHLDTPTFTRLVAPQVIGELQERRLLTERTEHRYRSEVQIFTVAHPLFTESLLADLPAFKRSMLLLDLADALSTSADQQPDDAARQLLWLHSAGHDLSSADLAGASSGLTASMLKSFVNATDVSAEALQAKERSDSSRLLATTVRDRYAETARLAELAYQQQPTPANAILLLRSIVAFDYAIDQATALLEYWLSDEERYKTLTPFQDLEFRRLSRLVYAYHRQDPETARAIVRKLPWPDGYDTAIRIELGSIDLNSGLIDEAADVLHEGVLDQSIDPLTRAVGGVELSIAWLSQGRIVDAIALIDEHFPLAISSGAEPSMVASYWWMRCIAAAYDGRFAEAETMLVSTFNFSVNGDSAEAAGFFADGLALVARIQGRHRTAVRRARQAVDLLAVRDVGQRAHALGELTLSLCAIGETLSARKALDELVANQTLRPSGRPMLALCRIYVESLEGRPIGVDDFNHAYEELQACGSQALGTLLWIATCTGQAKWAAKHVADLRSKLQGQLNAMQLTAIEALASDELSSLRDALTEANTMHAYGVAFVLAISGKQCAHRADRTDRTDRVDSVALRAEWEAHVTEARRNTEGAVEWSVATMGNRVALSRREAHIATLAQSGLSDAAIAERLGLSVRTVESHLTRVYAKLAIRGRRDLNSVSL
jgi:DNA-binding CsgD family transcriptional regulator